MKPSAHNEGIYQRPFHGLSGNHANATSARHAHRKVKKQSGLLNAINSLINYVKNSFRALEDFVCEACSWRDVENFGRDFKHNANKTLNEFHKATATSKKERAKYQAKMTLNDAQYRASKVKRSLSDWIKP